MEQYINGPKKTYINFYHKLGTCFLLLKMMKHDVCFQQFLTVYQQNI